jgi:competence protein ComEC
LWIAWLPSVWIVAVSRFFERLPGAALPWPPGLPGVALLAGLTTVLLVVTFAGGRVRRAAAIVGAVVLVAYAGAAVGIRVQGQLTRPQDWQVAVCDIGQGDATLVRSAGVVVLTDTGPDPALLTRCLDELDITRIDLLVLSHFDLDHVGGTDAVLGRVDAALVGPSDEPADDELVAALQAGGAVVTRASRGLTGVVGDLRWTVLWPKARLAGVEPGNDASIAMTFLPVGACIDGCLSALFLGDLGQQPQSLLLAAGPVPAVDVVKVSHHGSGDQESRLYGQASATVGAIGVGADNDYGHPTAALLALLAAVGTAAVRTDLDGLVLLSPGESPGSVAVWTEK